MQENKAIVCLLVALLVCACAGPSHARKVVVVVANRLTLSDISAYSLANINTIISNGASGLISPNCAGKKTEASVLATTSAGTPMRADDSLREVREASEPYSRFTTCGEEFALRTGERAQKGSGVLLNSAIIERLNAGTGAGGRIGLVGQACRESNIGIAALGNSDSGKAGGGVLRDRAFAVLAADERGVVHTFIENPPGMNSGDAGLLCEPTLFVEAIKSASADNEIIIACFPDISRLDDQKLRITPEAFAVLKKDAMRNLDTLAGELIDYCKESDAVLVVASFGLPDFKTWDQLTPILTFNAQTGLLQSASTRTPGLITAADISPTLLSLAEITQTHNSVGMPAYTVTAVDPLQNLQKLNARVRTNRRLLIPMGGAVAGLCAIVSGLISVAGAFDVRALASIRPYLRFSILLAMSLPAGLMLAAAFPPGVLWYVSASLLISFLLALLASVFFKPERPGLAAAAIYAVTCVLIVGDALGGAWLCRFSMPSSYQLSGMRYFGTGNEYAAFLMGMLGYTLVYFAGSARRTSMALQWVLGIGLLTVFTLGWGKCGANYGATAATAAMFMLIIIALVRGRVCVAGFLLSLVAGVGISVIFSEIDAIYMSTFGTHAGRVAASAASGGLDFALGMLVRKVTFNARTLVSKPALFSALAFAPFLILWFYRIRRKVALMLKGNPGLTAGYSAAALAGIYALLLNDSGVVMAALILAALMCALVLAVLEWEGRRWDV